MHTTSSACPTGLQPTTDLEHLGERIATLSAQISVATHQLLVLLREFDQREGWGTAFAAAPTG